MIYAAVASRQGLAFRLESPEGELFVSADELRIRQILINLISNAIKYNRPGGEVALRLELLSTDEKELSVRLSVEDTGIGIKKREPRRDIHRIRAGGAQRRRRQRHGAWAGDCFKDCRDAGQLDTC